MEAMNLFWHQDCFKCASCSTALGTVPFHPQGGKPYCSNCYHSNFAKVCGTCNEAISGSCLEALGKSWHQDCFVCAECHQPFPGGEFIPKDGTPYCTTHFHEKFGVKCAGCNQAIVGDFLNAVGKKWHAACLKCGVCSADLPDAAFYERNNIPHCATCFTSSS